MKQQNQLTAWVINKIEKEYKDDISLLIGIKGHSTDGDQHGVCFDYFIPATERGNEISETFIIDGVGHDLYPRSWERLEDSVSLDDMVIILDQAEILYSRSKEDEDRLFDMKKRLHENLNNVEFVYGKALEYMDKALEIYRSLIFEEKSYRIRAEIGYIQQYLSKAVAVLNHTYTESPIYSEKQAHNENPESRMYHCPKLKEVPEKFFENAKLLLTEKQAEKQMEIILLEIKAVRKFILDRAPERKKESTSTVNFSELREWYQELSLTWRRIRYFCEKNLAEEAYVDAIYLQEELLFISQEFGVLEMNLLDSFDKNDLSLLKERADSLEKIILQIFKDNHIFLKSYESVEKLISERI